MNLLPLPLQRLDHYTLIVPDAEACTRFHIDVLGFTWVKEQLVNAGTAPEGSHDMLNHVLHLPDDPSRVMVVTEGLTKESIFHRYMEEHGAGIHHVAYEVQNLQECFDRLRQAGIKLTSDHIMNDPVSGLRQVFVSKEATGYFIELIERTSDAASGVFKHDNMRGLANTMEGYVARSVDVAPGSDEGHLSQVVPAPIGAVTAFLTDLSNLPSWTAHQTVQRTPDGWVEHRRAGPVALSVREEGHAVVFEWAQAERTFAVRFVLDAEGEDTKVSLELPKQLTGERRARTRAVLEAELALLAHAHGASLPPDVLTRHRHRVGDYHLEVYQRPSL